MKQNAFPTLCCLQWGDLPESHALVPGVELALHLLDRDDLAGLLVVRAHHGAIPRNGRGVPLAFRMSLEHFGNYMYVDLSEMHSRFSDVLDYDKF